MCTWYGCVFVWEGAWLKINYRFKRFYSPAQPNVYQLEPLGNNNVTILSSGIVDFSSLFLPPSSPSRSLFLFRPLYIGRYSCDYIIAQLKNQYAGVQANAIVLFL